MEKEAKPSVSEVEVEAMHKRVFAIGELIKTEQDYVRDLGLVVNGYIASMQNPENKIKMPQDLRDGRDKLVFGNIEEIYDWHKNFFLPDLEKCVEHPEEVGPLFTNSQRKLYMHVLYCQNRALSECIVSKHNDTYFLKLKTQMHHKLQLSDLLIMPVQRLTRYLMLLQEVAKFTERANLKAQVEALQQAIQTLGDLAKAGNYIVDLNRLQGFDGKLAAQGQLLLQGPLLCCKRTTAGASFKGKELQVFLFEQIIIFSEAEGKKTQYTSPVYKYKNHIQVNKASLEETVAVVDESYGGGVELFCVRSTDPQKPGPAYTCQASTAERRAEWIHSLRNILQMQKNFIKALQVPIKHQNELKRANSTPSN